MESDSQIDIVLTCWARLNFTRWAIQSIYENTQSPHRLIVIDNGSSGNMQAELLGMKRQGFIDQLVLLDQNYGLEYAKHLGMAFVESELFVSTDNDILAYAYRPDWLVKLKELMRLHPDYGAIACRPQILVGTGNIFDKVEEDVVEFSHVPGYLRLMRTDIVKQTGAWNDKRPLRGHEEFWISNKLKEAGWKVGWAKDVQCWHLFGSGNWGYDPFVKPEEHGHTPVSNLPQDNRAEILEKTGITVYG